jgi:hypothetical protein
MSAHGMAWLFIYRAKQCLGNVLTLLVRFGSFGHRSHLMVYQGAYVCVTVSLPFAIEVRVAQKVVAETRPPSDLAARRTEEHKGSRVN